MTQSPNVSTMDALQAIGFVPSQSPENRDGLAFKFDNGDIEAFPPDHTGRVFLLGSVDGTPRTQYPPFEHYLPENVVSEQQCAALLSYYLRHYAIQPQPSWLIEGQQRHDLLPWNLAGAQRQGALDALPKCSVKREWMRLALKDLGASLAEAQGAPVLFNFSDGVLSIEHGGKKIAVTASGSNWPRPVAVHASEFQSLPKRLMKEEIPVVVGESYVMVDTTRYARIPADAS